MASAEGPSWLSRVVDVLAGGMIFATVLCVPSFISFVAERWDKDQVAAWLQLYLHAQVLSALAVAITAAAVVWLVRPRDEA